MLEQPGSDLTALGTEDAHERPMAPVWIPATLGVGLLLAAVYLGGRILTGHAPLPAPVKTVAVVAAEPAPSPPPKSEPVSEPKTETLPPPEETKPVSADQLPMIAPQAGERYIQVAAVAALSVDDTRRYLAQLRRDKLDPHLAPGPSPELLRVLIGPFANQDALEQTQSDLARARIKHFIRKY
jgi:cell division septation protein DedD